MRYVIDSSVFLHLISKGLTVNQEHTLLSPTLVRSQVLDALYQRRGEMSDKEGRDLLDRFAEIKVRYLGDRVLRQQAWKVAEELGWDSTADAEFIALTQLQGDALVTLDRQLAKQASKLVTVAPIDALI